MRPSSTTCLGIILGLLLLLLAAACGGRSAADETTDDTDDVATETTTSSSAPPPQTTVTGVEQIDDEGDPADADQDGVVAGDNCPRDFNPAQGDDDGDGVGNVCDERTDITVDCGFSSSTTSEIAAASGDEEIVTVCQMLSSDQPLPSWVALGTPILITDEYLLIDFTPEQIAEARRRGLEAVVVDSVAGRQPADLLELRIEQDPTRALATVDPDVLGEVDPELIGRVPPDVLAAQPDRTLAAVPDEFWADAPTVTLDVVGRERLVTINPRVRLADLQIAPRGQLELQRSTAITSTSTRPATSSPTTAISSTNTSTTGGGGDG